MPKTTHERVTVVSSPTSQRHSAERKALARLDQQPDEPEPDSDELDYQTVYYLCSEDEELLYVGISGATMARLAQHSNKPWWRQVAYVKVEHMPSRQEAELRERQVIQQLQPRYNVTYNRVRRCCANCGTWPIRRAEHCEACDRYLRRHGTDRPEQLWV